MNRVIIKDFVDVLKEKGVNYLTSESDGTGMRVLYDLTEEGAELVAEAFGGWISLPTGWNDGVKSIMLFRELFRPLAIYALLRDGNVVVTYHTYKSQEHITAIQDANLNSAEWQDYIVRVNAVSEGKWHLYKADGTARDGLRNQHVFSGRVE